MKKFKFNLEAVLKLRKLAEEKCKMEIGQMQMTIIEYQKDMHFHNVGIDQAYDSQEVALEDGVSGQEARFHPYFVSGKRAHIDQIQREVDRINEQVAQKFEELAKLRANVKVIEEMKEKKKLEYKKSIQKKMDLQLEEDVQNWWSQNKA